MGLTGFDMSLLQQKYAAMTKQADADMIRAMNSGGGGSSIGGGVTDPNAALQQELLQAQIKNTLASTNATNTTASATEDEALRNEKAFDQTYTKTGPSRDQLRDFFLAQQQIEADKKAAAETVALANEKKTGLGLKKGITKVPGKGNGKVDKVDAKLAPGEAVLNKAAAEHLGRGVITALNALGRQKMGMV